MREMRSGAPLNHAMVPGSFTCPYCGLTWRPADPLPESGRSRLRLSARFVVRGRRRFAHPLANDHTQFVGPLLQLVYPLHLHGHVTADFRDLAFNGVRQFGGFAPTLSSPHGTCHLGLRRRFRHGSINGNEERQTGLFDCEQPRS